MNWLNIPTFPNWKKLWAKSLSILRKGDYSLLI